MDRRDVVPTSSDAGRPVVDGDPTGLASKHGPPAWGQCRPSVITAAARLPWRVARGPVRCRWHTRPQGRRGRSTPPSSRLPGAISLIGPDSTSASVDQPRAGLATRESTSAPLAADAAICSVSLGHRGRSSLRLTDSLGGTRSGRRQKQSGLDAELARTGGEGVGEACRQLVELGSRGPGHHDQVPGVHLRADRDDGLAIVGNPPLGKATALRSGESDGSDAGPPYQSGHQIEGAPWRTRVGQRRGDELASRTDSRPWAGYTLATTGQPAARAYAVSLPRTPKREVAHPEDGGKSKQLVGSVARGAIRGTITGLVEPSHRTRDADRSFSSPGGFDIGPTDSTGRPSGSPVARPRPTASPVPMFWVPPPGALAEDQQRLCAVQVGCRQKRAGVSLTDTRPPPRHTPDTLRW